MKKINLFIIISCICSFGSAVTAFGQLSGRVLAKDSTPVIRATIEIYRAADSVLVASMSSDSTGRFSMILTPDGYHFALITNIGFESWRSPNFQPGQGRSLDLGTRILRFATGELNAVSVTARKPMVKQTPFGTTVNVEGSVLSKGSSILDVLERSPGVMLDRRNNAITLNGKTGVMVMMNGKLMRLPADQVVTLLGGMSSNDIEKIELLNTPPVSYDADGSAGVINIVTKKQLRKGLNGSASLTAGQGWGSKAMGSFNISSGGKSFDFSAAYAYSYDHTKTGLDILSSQDMPVFGGGMQVTVWDTSKAMQQNHNLSGGVSFHPDTLNNFSLNLAANISNRDLVVADRSHYLLLPDSMLYFRGDISSQNKWKDWSGSISWDRKLNRGGKVGVSVDHMRYANHNPSLIKSLLLDSLGKQAGNNDTLFAPDQRGLAFTDINVSVGKADYQQSVNKKLQIEAGVKGTLTNSNSRSGIESFVNGKWINRDETINAIEMRESISAAYVSMGWQPSAGIDIRIGARYESARTTMEQAGTGEKLVDRELHKVFPGFSFVKQIAENSELQFSYSERITRPTYNDLASFVRYSDATAVYTGNPALKPTLTRNIKLGYVYKKLGFNIQASRDQDPFANYQLTKSAAGNLLYVSPQNLRYKNYLNLQMILPFKIADWWNITASIVTGWTQFALDYTTSPVKKTYYANSLNLAQVFDLPAKYTIEISGWFNSASYNGTTKVGAMGALNAGVRKELNNNGGRLQLSVSDLFRTLKIDSQYGTITEEAYRIKNLVSFRAESSFVPVFKLTYSRSFGNAKATSTRGVSQEETSRIRKD